MKVRHDRLTLMLGNLVLPLDGEHGFIATELDVGWPDVREVVSPIPGFSGTDDVTSLFGARVVSINAALDPDVKDPRMLTLGRLARFCNPADRPVLVIEEDGRAARSIDLRPTKLSAPLAGKSVTDVQVSWVAPSGVIRATVPTVAQIPVARGSAAGGRAYDLSYDRSYPAADPPGVVTVANGGDLPASWRLRLFGYCTSPTVTVDGVGDLVQFGTGPVPAGAYWECDSVARTVFEDSMVSASRRNVLDFAASTWAALPPGESTVTFTGGAPSGTCMAEIEWYDQWLI